MASYLNLNNQVSSITLIIYYCKWRKMSECWVIIEDNTMNFENFTPGKEYNI